MRLVVKRRVTRLSLTSTHGYRSQRTVSRPASWHLADLLDFESLLVDDAARTNDALLARDRAIFEKLYSGTRRGETDTGRSVVFHEWLDARRAQESDALPGDAVRTGWDALLNPCRGWRAAAWRAGVCAGVLRYPGSEPVNVSVFLGATLGPQFIVRR